MRFITSMAASPIRAMPGESEGKYLLRYVAQTGIGYTASALVASRHGKNDSE
jgi:hypothetical protein